MTWKLAAVAISLLSFSAPALATTHGFLDIDLDIDFDLDGDAGDTSVNIELTLFDFLTGGEEDPYAASLTGTLVQPIEIGGIFDGDISSIDFGDSYYVMELLGTIAPFEDPTWGVTGSAVLEGYMRDFDEPNFYLEVRSNYAFFGLFRPSIRYNVNNETFEARMGLTLFGSCDGAATGQTCIFDSYRFDAISSSIPLPASGVMLTGSAAALAAFGARKRARA